jgi:lysozyme
MSKEVKGLISFVFMNWPKSAVFLPDLSHYEWPVDLNKLADAGCVGVIWKATQGSGNRDSTYEGARAAAYAAGLLWGAYHFADGSDVEKQVANYLSYALPNSNDLVCLDFEDYDSAMSLDDAQAWILATEDNLQRPEEAVLYSGNRIKEELGSRPSSFWGRRRLWLCQYGENPSWPAAWDRPWLWQFTDGSIGPEPHSCAGTGSCDVNYYPGSEQQLIAEWSSGKVEPTPPTPPPSPPSELTVTVLAPKGVKIVVVKGDAQGT